MIHRLIYTAFGLIAGVLALGSFHSSLQGDTWPVVLSGQLAPGTANGRFTAFGQPSVNASGDIAFYAALNVGGVQSAGVFKIVGGVLSPVVLEGQLLPDSSGRFFGGALGRPQINSAGDILLLANFSGSSPWKGIFLNSGGMLRMVVDNATPIPGAPGQTFNEFHALQINDAGDVIFEASAIPDPSASGIYEISRGNTRSVTRVTTDSLSLNNNGDIALTTFPDSVSLLSGGSMTQVASQGQAVPNSKLQIQLPRSPSINDSKDIVFVTYRSGCCTGRGASTVFPAGVVRWRNGALEKIVAEGDPVPGLPGSVFDAQFGQPQINRAGVIFSAKTFGTSAQPGVNVIGRSQDGGLSTVVKDGNVIDGIGALNFVGQPSFDSREGSLVTFVAEATFASGIFSATSAQFPLLFPQIADGTSSGGGWRTTFDFVNRSTTMAAAKVSFYSDDGAPMNVSVDGRQLNEVFLTVPALGVTQFQTEGKGPLATGWASVQADQNLSGIALFGFFDGSGHFINEVGAPASVPLRSMSIFVQAGASISTGLALANPNRVPSEVTLILRDANFERTGENVADDSAKRPSCAVHRRTLFFKSDGRVQRKARCRIDPAHCGFDPAPAGICLHFVSHNPLIHVMLETPDRSAATPQLTQ